MKRIESRLKELSKDNQKAFVGYIVAGDPDLETSLDLMHLSVESGVDILVSGTTIFKNNNGDIKKNIDLLRSI